MIYIDPSAFLDRMLRQNNHARIDKVLRGNDRAESPQSVTSSRLLRLEARRVQARESLDWAVVERVELLPVTEEVWRGAFDIATHVRTLDALHLATCSLIEATLLTSDDRMAQVAADLSVDVIHQ